MWVPIVVVVIFVSIIWWQIDEIKSDIDALKGHGTDIEELEFRVDELEERLVDEIKSDEEILEEKLEELENLKNLRKKESKSKINLEESRL